MPCTPTSLIELPDDILRVILDKLSFRYLVRAGAICKQLHQLQPRCIKVASWRERVSSAWLAEHLGMLEVLEAFGTPQILGVLAAPDGKLAGVVQELSLILNSSDIDFTSLTALSSMPRLRKLRLDRVGRVFNDPHIKLVSPASLTHIELRCMCLSHLDMARCSRLQSVRLVGTTLDGCMLPPGQRLGELRVLETSATPEILNKLAAPGSKLAGVLEELSLTFDSNDINFTPLTALSSMTLLTKLWLDIAPWRICALHIELGLPAGLTHVELRKMKLSRLDASRCSRLQHVRLVNTTLDACILPPRADYEVDIHVVDAKDLWPDLGRITKLSVHHNTDVTAHCSQMTSLRTADLSAYHSAELRAMAAALPASVQQLELSWCVSEDEGGDSLEANVYWDELQHAMPGLQQLTLDGECTELFRVHIATAPLPPVLCCKCDGVLEFVDHTGVHGSTEVVRSLQALHCTRKLEIKGSSDVLRAVSSRLKYSPGTRYGVMIG